MLLQSSLRTREGLEGYRRQLTDADKAAGKGGQGWKPVWGLLGHSGVDDWGCSRSRLLFTDTFAPKCLDFMVN